METQEKKNDREVGRAQPRGRKTVTEPVSDLIEQGAICPYFQRDRGLGRVYCECAHFRFPDKEARREIVYAFCAHPVGYKTCSLKRAMDHFYERKYANIEK